MIWSIITSFEINKFFAPKGSLDSNPSPSAAPILGKDDWKKELVNGSHWHMIKGLKPGSSYRVRVVARDPADPTVHSTDEVLVAVPGEAACLSVDEMVLVLLFSVLAISFHHPLSVIRHTALHSDVNVQ